MGVVLVLGSLNIDLVTRVERHPAPGETLLGEGLERLAGGKGANQAVAAAALVGDAATATLSTDAILSTDATLGPFVGGRVGADGSPVVMVGCVGSDAGGAAYRARLAARGLDVSGIREVDGVPSGHALIAVDEQGENTIIVVAGANGEVGDAEVERVRDLGPGDVLLLQLEVPLAAVSAAARLAHHRGARVIINIAPYAGLPADVIALADPVVANEHEAALLAESAAVPASLLVTFGARGASWDGLTLPAHEVRPGAVLDTTGAGDAFCGALAASLAGGVGRRAALDAALAAGAAAVQHHGAQPDPVL